MAEFEVKQEASKLGREAERLRMALQQHFTSVKLLGEELEQEHRSQLVERMVPLAQRLDLMYSALGDHAQALQSVSDWYHFPQHHHRQQQQQQQQLQEAEGSQPGNSSQVAELTDWSSALGGRIEQLKRERGGGAAQDGRVDEEASGVKMVKELKRAIWNVHHPSEPMPGEAEDDVALLTQCNVKNHQCPLTLTSVLQLQDPVCGQLCRHIFSRAAILGELQRHGSRRNPSIKCPMSGCQQRLKASDLVMDTELELVLDELRQRTDNTGLAGTNRLDEEVEDLS